MKTIQLNYSIFLMVIWIFSADIGMTQAGEKVKSATPEIQSTNRVYYLQVRVIFAGQTGIFGNVIPELSDMRDLLTQNFKYPSYELSNTIRLSLFGDEEATALVFPDHYLRIIPKGSGKANQLRVKVELYFTPPQSEIRTRFQMGEIPNQIQFQEKNKEDSHSDLFPIVGSAMILMPHQWDAIGGVPVRVSTSGNVSSNTLSSSPISQSRMNAPTGASKFLILGIQLDEVRMESQNRQSFHQAKE